MINKTDRSKKNNSTRLPRKKEQSLVLAERVKELNCLYAISKISEKRGLDLEGIIRQTIEVIPTAWQYPDIAGAHVALEGKSFRTRKFAHTRWIQECPIIVRGLLVGTLAVSYSQKRPEQDEGPFLKEERNLLNIAAQKLGDMIERKWSEQELLRYQEELRSLAAELALSEERERRRIAQALHDRIGQVLALINIKIGAMLAPPQTGQLKNELREIRRLVSDCIAETRSLTFDLSPPILYELGFGAALEWLAERIQQQYGVNVEIGGYPKNIPLSTEWQATLFNATRELLVNVGKHAKTKSARVSLRKTRTEIIALVEDRGVGMNTERSKNEKSGGDGFGLFSIRERFGIMGGRFELSSRRGKGTSISLYIPLNSGTQKRG
jgi:two-component system, NarL family, sensor kinase